MKKLKRFLKNLIVHEDYIKHLETQHLFTQEHYLRRIEKENLRVLSNHYPMFM